MTGCSEDGGTDLRTYGEKERRDGLAGPHMLWSFTCHTAQCRTVDGRLVIESAAPQIPPGGAGHGHRTNVAVLIDRGNLELMLSGYAAC